jgi:hypothetical protein
LKQFRRIYHEFGTGALVRTLVLLIGLCALSLFDYFSFSSIRAAVIALLGLSLGWLFREMIVEAVDYSEGVLRGALIAYSIILTVGQLLDVNGSAQLAVITAMTVISFDFQFWSLSDPSIVDAE